MAEAVAEAGQKMETVSEAPIIENGLIYLIHTVNHFVSTS